MGVTAADKVAAEIRILGPACAQCGARRDGGCRYGEPTDDDDRRAEASLDAIRDGDDGDDPGLGVCAAGDLRHATGRRPTT